MAVSMTLLKCAPIVPQEFCENIEESGGFRKVKIYLNISLLMVPGAGLEPA